MKYRQYPRLYYLLKPKTHVFCQRPFATFVLHCNIEFRLRNSAARLYFVTFPARPFQARQVQGQDYLSRIVMVEKLFGLPVFRHLRNYTRHKFFLPHILRNLFDFLSKLFEQNKVLALK